MKSTRLYILLCVGLLGAIASGASAQIGEMIPVTINAPGHVEEIPFDLDKPSAVSIQAFFPAAELGVVIARGSRGSRRTVAVLDPHIKMSTVTRSHNGGT